MKLGIMQPYFFPYIGYFDLINRTDRWVVFDVVQYVPKSWMNRNRILHPTDGWQYVSVPVVKHRETLIKDVLLVDRNEAHRRVLGQIEHYRNGRAPFFEPVRELIDRCFLEASSGRLRDLNVSSLALVCEYVGVDFSPVVFSESDIELPPIEHPGQWALEIGSAMGASEYVNPPGGKDLFDERAFAERGIRLEFTELADFRYACGSYDFVERLSIIDVLMWNEPKAVKAQLDAMAGR